jgi:hypothetical protein
MATGGFARNHGGLSVLATQALIVEAGICSPLLRTSLPKLHVTQSASSAAFTLRCGGHAVNVNHPHVKKDTP